MQTFALLQGLDWVWEMLKLVLASAVPPGRDLPRIIFSEHLSHLSRDTWLGFETAIVAHTRYATIGKAILNCMCIAQSFLCRHRMHHCLAHQVVQLHRHWTSVCLARQSSLSAQMPVDKTCIMRAHLRGCPNV